MLLSAARGASRSSFCYVRTQAFYLPTCALAAASARRLERGHFRGHCDEAIAPDAPKWVHRCTLLLVNTLLHPHGAG
jgi:hypothetical protein